MSDKTRHPSHLVDESPWPILTSLGGLSLAVSLIAAFHVRSWTLTYVSLMMVISISFTWMRDICREGTYQGLHTKIVETGLKWGMSLFIVSEVLFFASFFWAFFHSSLSPNIELGSQWPPSGVQPFNPWGVPLLNTLILISSGISVTWCHEAIQSGHHSQSVGSQSTAVFLGVYFTIYQGMEYHEASFSISDSVYGSTFFIATGFHGLHVIIGTVFLFSSLLRTMAGSGSETHHLGLKAGIWYWHFVDVVWLFLFFWIYVWGGSDSSFS